MSVQCKNCIYGLRSTLDNTTLCVAWERDKRLVNAKKQRLCERYYKR